LRPLLRVRWLLAGVVAFAFALGQVVEAAVIGSPAPGRLELEVLRWSALGGAAVWWCVAWVSRQDVRHEAGMERALGEQQELNRRLRRANELLALLSEVNRGIAESATLDEILDHALAFPRRLVPARAAALLLVDADGAVEARLDGATRAELDRWRARLGVAPPTADERGPRWVEGAGDRGQEAAMADLLRPRDPCPPAPGACLLMPLHDGVAPVGWIELYRDGPAPELPEDELALLETIGSEVAEAVVSARRRTREERKLYELERSISEERARIARDIHDGLAQTLAFQRMRVDLWLDWIESDPERLRRELIAFKEGAREQIQELRRAIFALRPVPFDELGFAGGLERYVVEFATQQGWQARVDVGRAPPSLPPELEATTFRIVQEALTNTAKHAAATRIEVALERADEGLLVTVRDDGRGFDPEREGAAARDRGDGTARLGLTQMRERLAALRGRLTIRSQPGAGADLRAWIPLPDGAAARDRTPPAAVPAAAGG